MVYATFVVSYCLWYISSMHEYSVKSRLSLPWWMAVTQNFNFVLLDLSSTLKSDKGQLHHDPYTSREHSNSLVLRWFSFTWQSPLVWRHRIDYSSMPIIKCIRLPLASLRFLSWETFTFFFLFDYSHLDLDMTLTLLH